MDNKDIKPAGEKDKLDAPRNKKAVFLAFLYKKRFWLVLGTIFILAAAALLYINYKLFTSDNIKNKINGGTVEDEDDFRGTGTNAKLVRRLIDGVFVKAGRENIYPLAVMIENHVDSRPPAGLAEANLVFEAEAEGSITRFLAIYASEENIKKIGPIRSARPYFLDWVQEFDALYSHCGGSPDALVQIKQAGVKSLNEFYNGDYYWRDKTRSAPHNIFTSSENLKKAVDSFGFKKAVYESWKYKNDASADSRPETGWIKISYRTKPFIVDWEYSQEENTYLRIMGGEPHKDLDGRQIKAKNVIIAFIKTTVIDDELRIKLETIGQGKAIICLDGRCREGQWRKPEAKARTRFYLPKKLESIAEIKNLNDDYEEAELNAGPTWIEVVRPEYEVSY